MRTPVYVFCFFLRMLDKLYSDFFNGSTLLELIDAEELTSVLSAH